jgi:hypothetical protein
VVVTATVLPVVFHGSTGPVTSAPVATPSGGESSSDWYSAAGMETDVEAHTACADGKMVESWSWNPAQVNMEDWAVSSH